MEERGVTYRGASPSLPSVSRQVPTRTQHGEERAHARRALPLPAPHPRGTSRHPPTAMDHTPCAGARRGADGEETVLLRAGTRRGREKRAEHGGGTADPGEAAACIALC